MAIRIGAAFVMITGALTRAAPNGYTIEVKRPAKSESAPRALEEARIRSAPGHRTRTEERVRKRLQRTKRGMERGRGRGRKKRISFRLRFFCGGGVRNDEVITRRPWRGPGGRAAAGSAALSLRCAASTSAN
jgi:hypothetical protein